MAGNTVGRKPKLTSELIEEAAKVLRIGNYVKTTCGYIGVGEPTWYQWLKDAEQAKNKPESELTEREKLTVEFSIAITKAQDEAVIRNLQLIQTAATSYWQAAAWTLERRHPDMFSLAQRISITDNKEHLTAEDIKQALLKRKDSTENE